MLPSSAITPVTGQTGGGSSGCLHLFASMMFELVRALRCVLCAWAVFQREVLWLNGSPCPHCGARPGCGCQQYPTDRHTGCFSGFAITGNSGATLPVPTYLQRLTLLWIPGYQCWVFLLLTGPLTSIGTRWLPCPGEETHKQQAGSLGGEGPACSGAQTFPLEAPDR